jgi:hypothetical protein
LYLSPIIIRVIRSRKIRWVGHVTHRGEMRNAYKILVTNLKGRDHLGDISINGRTILTQILKIQSARV